MIENIRLSFQGIWSHKMRSFLTMLGIIIGIAAIIAIVSTIKGTNEQIKENLIGSGDNTVRVELHQGEWELEMDGGVPDGIYPITDKAKEQIQDIEHAESASVYYKKPDYGDTYYKNNSISGGYLYGIEKDYLKTCNYLVAEGRGFDKKDYENNRKVALLDASSKKTLFQGENALGKCIEIKGEPYTVIGVVEKSKAFEPVINSMEEYTTYMQETSGSVYVPKVTWPIIYRYDEPENVVVKVESTDDMTSVGKKTADILNKDLGVSDDSIKYKSEDLLEQAKEMQELSKSTNSMLIWIAGISLLVGGIGVMNIMLVSVTERTSEIGLKKAIGARKSVILGQFLTEAAVLTSLGGIAGVAIGVILAQVISKVSETPVAISIPAAIGAVLFSMLIGIVFGMLPSYKAANLNPIEALRHE
ncbi:MAG: ABC transporter permease [Lachnospiraceae bacterium]|nr:ABC transporter permease [Lachnospiraceae bacterium]